MGSYTYIKNTPITIDPVTDFADTGWSVSNNIAYHDGCNPGLIKYVMDLTGFTSWAFRFRLGTVFSGGINIVVDGINGVVRNVAGEYTETFNVSGSNVNISFFSDGKNSVEVLNTFPVLAISNGRTLVFNEDENSWGGDHSYQPEFMHKFIDSFLTFKNGRLWEHDINPLNNNFYGQQFTSKIKVVANEKYQFDKLYFGLKIDSNGKWSVPEMITPKSETYPNGMKSRLHENNFRLDRGKYWADILRDMLDPQFNTQLQALFEGRVVEGNMLIIELETKETKDIQLNGLFVYSSEQHRNF